MVIVSKVAPCVHFIVFVANVNYRPASSDDCPLVAGQLLMKYFDILMRQYFAILSRMALFPLATLSHLAPTGFIGDSKSA